MRFVHPVAIVGLLINAGLLWFLVSATSSLDISTLSAYEQELLYMVESLKPFLLILAGLQVLALVMLEYRTPGAMILAFITAFFTMPIGIVYLLGCLFTQNNVRFADFIQQKTKLAKPRASFASSQTKGLAIVGAIGVGAGIIFMMRGYMDFASVGICSGLAMLYMSSRTVYMPPLSFYDDHLVVVPILTANPIVLPYASIQKATLLADERVVFTVSTEAGEKQLQWRLTFVHQSLRKEALKLLADVLRAHHVTLE